LVAQEEHGATREAALVCCIDDFDADARVGGDVDDSIDVAARGDAVISAACKRQRYGNHREERPRMHADITRIDADLFVFLRKCFIRVHQRRFRVIRERS
jgi:hypothetical protein